jgi:hypothetical protein
MDIDNPLIERFFDPNERLNKTCPKCGSKNISFLQYGLNYDDDIDELIKTKEVILVGCLISDENLICRDCEFAWSSIEIMD